MQKKVYIGLSLIPLVIAIAGFISLWQSPYLGIQFESRDGKWYISSMAADSPAAPFKELIGKEVISIAGWAPAKWDLAQSFLDIRDRADYYHYWEAHQYLSEHVQAGAPLEIVIREDGLLKRVTVTPTPFSFIQLAAGFGLIFLTGFFTLLMGLIVVLKKNSYQAEVFFFLTFVISPFMFAHKVLWNQEIVLDHLTFQLLTIFAIVSLLMAPAILHFCMVFPREHKLARNRYVIWGMYLGFCITVFLYLMRVSYVHDIIYVYQIGNVILCAALLIRSYISLDSPIERAQVRWVVFGFMMLLILVPPIFTYEYITGHFAAGYLVVFLAFLPLTMAFAILKYRLMEIDTLFDATLIYSITLGLLALLDIGVISFLTQLKLLNFSISQPVSIIVSVWVIILAYVPLRNRVQDFIKGLLKREKYDLNDVSLSLSRSLLSASTVPQVLEKTRETLQKTLHPKGIQVHLSEEKNHLLNNRPEETGGALVPLVATAGPLGYLELKEKHSGRLYDKNDLKLLDTVASQAALAIEAIRYRQAMEKEKERISREIHDGMGSYFSTGIMMADMIRRDVSSSGGAVADRSSKLKELLEGGLAELRDLIWSTEPGEDTLESLGYYLERKAKGFLEGAGIGHEIAIDLPKDCSVPPAVRLNLLKMVMESLANAIKHSGASRVRFAMNMDGQRLTVMLEDNGKGFDQGLPLPGNGLKNLRKRAEQMNADLEIHSRQGEGTRVMIRLPL